MFVRAAARILDLVGHGSHGSATQLGPPSSKEARALGAFRYRRLGYDERRLELLAGGVIGRGRAGLERWWRIDENGCLVIGSGQGTTCRLVRDRDGVWRGRWLKFERMEIALVPTGDEEPWHAGASEPREPIDAVYTWVREDDPHFQATLRRYRPRSFLVRAPSETAVRRFRDNGELKYSLRSIERFAPFIRNIYLVTNGQVPGWINTRHPRLRLVRHEEIFPSPAHLPSFNSFAIEMHLHRIANLSQRFLYFNDDFLLGSPLSPEDVLPSSGAQVVLVDEPPHRGAVHGRSPFERGIRHTLSLFERELGALPRWTCAPHVPRLFDRERIMEIQDRFRDAVADTSAQRFRTASSLIWHLLYLNYVALAPHLSSRTEVRRLAPNGDYSFTMLSCNLKTMRDRLADVKLQRPKYLCFNDDLDSSAGARRVLDELRAFLDAYYPTPSSFES